MPYRLLIAVLIGITLQLSSFAKADEPRMSRSLAQYLRKVQITVQAGRIAVLPGPPGNKISSNSTEHSTKRTEQLLLDLTTGSPAIHYESSDAQSRVVIDLSGGNRLTIRRTVQMDSPTVELEFDQLPGAPLRLTVSDDANKRQFEGRSIWHLLLAEPQLCQRELIPLVELLNPGLKLKQQAVEIEHFLATWARDERQAEGIRWDELIAKLASPTFAERRAAERALRRAGDRALPILENLDLKRLDEEQRYRIRQIIDDLSGEGSDTPSRIALRLSADPQIWLAMLASSDSARRAIAAEQLRKLVATPIDFDPDADQETRDEQLGSLREKLRKSE